MLTETLSFDTANGATTAYATAPVLILVGASMFRSVGKISFTRIEESLPAFLTIILIPLTFSITQGILWGFISHVGLYLIVGRRRDWRLTDAIGAFVAGRAGGAAGAAVGRVGLQVHALITALSLRRSAAAERAEPVQTSPVAALSRVGARLAQRRAIADLLPVRFRDEPPLAALVAAQRLPVAPPPSPPAARSSARPRRRGGSPPARTR